MQERLRGIFPPIPTTFDDRGDLDPAAIASNVRKWMTTGLAGILALGSNGEAGMVDEDESDRVVGAVRQAMPDGRLLLVGTGRESTRATIAATRRAADLGADAVLIRTPSFFKSQMTMDVLAKHYVAVADASPVAVLLYNLPGPTGISLTVPLIQSLADHPNIVGVKETSPELDRLGQFAAVRPDRFSVMCGWAPVMYPAVVAGATGGILAVANVLPEETIALFEHARAGRHAEALALQRRLTLIAQLVSTTHGVAGLKAALDLVGYRGGAVRAPLQPVPDRVRKEIGQAIEAARRVEVVRG
ncbi:MAG TPA: dihydrodipicolinate synthase family protein [Vicinamibacterales bacterium]|jgi:4-hydroxy-2-oxoglutarate aldolase